MTLTAFFELVARELELLPAGQPLEEDIRATLDAVYTTRWSMLARKGLAPFPKDNVPDAYAGPLAVWLASYAAGQLLDAAGAADKRALRGDAENDLRILAGDKRTDRPAHTYPRSF